MPARPPTPPRSRSRRRFVRSVGGGAVALWVAAAATGQERRPLARAVPASGELLPVIGMGTWITFDAGEIPAARQNLLPVLQNFFDAGGAVIDSSPMYGSSESVVGELLPQVKGPAKPFAATKVWTPGRALGVVQMERSRQLWDVRRFDLMQIHNMLDWQTHVETLKAMKAAGKVRYIGITTSHGARHDAMERAMVREPFDFVQFTYNLADRSVEQRLLPLAAERRIAVIVNRPFDGGALFRAVRGRRLPDYAREIECTAWSQLFLKFIVSHPAVTCTIPATSNPGHMSENMRALYGPLPDAPLRKRIAETFAAL